jgi:hypothetical protein
MEDKQINKIVIEKDAYFSSNRLLRKIWESIGMSDIDSLTHGMKIKPI